MILLMLGGVAAHQHGHVDDGLPGTVPAARAELVDASWGFPAAEREEGPLVERHVGERPFEPSPVLFRGREHVSSCTEGTNERKTQITPPLKRPAL